MSKNIHSEIQWCDVDSSTAKTAICPSCGIDSLLALDSNRSDEQKLIRLMNSYWLSTNTCDFLLND